MERALCASRLMYPFCSRALSRSKTLELFVPKAAPISRTVGGMRFRRMKSLIHSSVSRWRGLRSFVLANSTPPVRPDRRPTGNTVHFEVADQ
jgi:hypothetical protein